MNTPEDLAGQMAGKTDQQLQDILAQPEDWIPEALDAVGAELQKRGIPPVEAPPKPGASQTAKRQRNYFAIASLIGAIIGFFTLGAANTETQLRVTATIGGLIGVASFILGIIAMSKAKTLHRGRIVAIIGIILSCFVALGVLHVPLYTAHKWAVQSAAKRIEGQKSPQFAFSGKDGASVTDASLMGAVYVLDFNPSPEALPKLDSFAQRHKDDGLKVFVVFPNAIGQRVTEFMHSNGLDDLHVLTHGKDVAAFPGSYNSAETVVIGRDGKVRKVLLESNYEGEIDEAVSAAITAK